MQLTVDDALFHRAREGAGRALALCLSLETGDAVTIFFDDATAPCARALSEAAVAARLRVLEHRVTVGDYRRFIAAGRLADRHRESIDQSRGVLLCLEPTQAPLEYRKALLDAAVDLQRYVGVLPGATLPVLAQALDIDYDQVRTHCEDLAVAMLRGDRAVLTTYRCAEGCPIEAAELSMTLGGFGRSPITSIGIIPRGTWGNLPGGETFIAPVERTADGAFVLNGAFKSCVLRGDRVITLRFAGGELTDVEGSAPERVQLETLVAWRDARAYDLPLAELGVGMNAGIGALTGNALFDEKVAGTAHIALGDNNFYGGTLKRPLHEDLVSRGASLTIDGKPVMDHGRFVLDPADWRETAAEAIALGASLPADFIISATPTHAAPDASRRLRVRRDVGSRRQCSYTVGTDELAVQLGRLHALLPPSPERIWFSLIATRWPDSTVNRIALKGMLAILARHEVITLARAGDSDCA
jgi:leucyl aminopeptidase (aminopeptidase T)